MIKKAKKITLYMETTKKSQAQSIMEIQGVLKKLGARDVLIKYDDTGDIEAMSFSIQTDNGFLYFQMPIDYRPIWGLARVGRTKYIKTEEQAKRVALRQVYRWMEVQAAFILTGMVKTEEVFLPYVLVDEKRTMYEALKASGFKNMLPAHEIGE